MDARVGVVCVSVPEDNPRSRESDIAAIKKDAQAELARLPRDRYTLATSDRWSVQIEPEQCPSAGAGADAGAPIFTDAGADDGRLRKDEDDGGA